MSESIWEKNLSISDRNQLKETIKTDVCIIGASTTFRVLVFNVTPAS